VRSISTTAGGPLARRSTIARRVGSAASEAHQRGIDKEYNGLNMSVDEALFRFRWFVSCLRVRDRRRERDGA
jgi:hypothetical protein